MKGGVPYPSVDTTQPVTSAEIQSYREWLDSWGDGPHWADSTGQTVPINKTSLRRLLDALERRSGGAP